MKQYIFSRMILVLSATLMARALCPTTSGNQKVLPGLSDSLGRGIDITKYCPTFPGNVATQYTTFPCVLKMTLGNQTFLDPYNNVTYSVWDNVAIIIVNTDFTEELVFSLNTMADFDEWADLSINAKTHIFGSYKASAALSEYFNAGFENNMTVVLIHDKIEAYRAGFSDPGSLEPDEGFENAVKKLPTLLWSLPSNYMKWESHFSSYGTHYVNSAMLGGGYYYLKFLDTFYVHSAAGADFSAQGKIDFLYLLELSGAVGIHTHAAGAAYVNAGINITNCAGALQLAGACKQHDNDTKAFEAWENAVPANPATIGLDLVLNSELLAEPIKFLYNEVTVTYIGWAGINWLHTMAIQANTSLTRVINITPNCSCHSVKPCAVDAEGNQTISIIQSAQANAKVLVSKLAVTINNITAALTRKNTISAKLPSPAQLASMITNVGSIASKAFSFPKFVNCTSYLSAKAVCRSGGATGCPKDETQVCCNKPGVVVGYCEEHPNGKHSGYACLSSGTCASTYGIKALPATCAHLIPEALLPSNFTS
eukprot:m.21574 g.21574  ORF g.21574 m.21574 type:complete len:539 (+) comp7183_c0_seq2:1518-3134(+)